MSKSRQYELIYIVAPESSEEVLADLVSQITDIASRFDGTIENTEEWGRRKLAYEIAGHRDGVYVLHLLNGGGDMVKEIDRRLRVIDTVIRHLVIRVDEALRVAQHTRERRVSRMRRRRIARGLSPDPEPRHGEGGGGAPPPTPTPKPTPEATAEPTPEKDASPAVSAAEASESATATESATASDASSTTDPSSTTESSSPEVAEAKTQEEG